MKNKKVSAFAMFKNKPQQGVQTKPMKATRSNADFRKNNRSSSSIRNSNNPATNVNFQENIKTEPSPNRNRKQVHRNLERSPMKYPKRRSGAVISEEEIVKNEVKVNNAQAAALLKKSNRSMKKQKKRRSNSFKEESTSILVEGMENNDKSYIVNDEQEKDDDSAKVSEDSSSLFRDSLQESERCFSWMIYPVKPKNFFEDIWEKKPLLVKRQHNPFYYKGIFSTDDFDTILREKNVWFGKNIDITTYVNGKRETHTPEGRAHAPVVWDYYRNGSSVRLLNPQTFSRSVWRLNSILQEYFSSCVGANVYLTPPGSQGFAPHYDDIEAFILQLEGKKRWKVYAPRCPVETLPRYSSDNLSNEDLGENILNVELEPGDLLYFPRGYIHQASTVKDTHSLHITVSASQRNTWGDYLEKLLPKALQILFENDIEFRRSLPIDYVRCLGCAHSDVKSPARDNFMKTLKNLMGKLVANLPVDDCADQVAKNYIHDCLPPVLTKAERGLSVFGSNVKWENGKVVNFDDFDGSVSIKLTRGNIMRLITEENVLRVYYSMENSREYHGEEPQFIEIVPEMAPGVEFLLHSYPNFVKVDDLPVENYEERMTLATALYERGLVVTSEPLKSEN